MNEYITVRHAGMYEYEDRKSRFIGQAQPVTTEEEALAHLQIVKKTYPDARHHVYAYLLRSGAMRFSDDHEPQGTAGVPILDLLRKQEITDVCVVVTRYFGGTLLGTGGLVRAYTEAAAGALRAAEVVTCALYAVTDIRLTYPDYQKFAAVCTTLGFRTEKTEYADEVTVTGAIPAGEYDAFFTVVTDMTGGRAHVKKQKEIFST